MSGSALAALNPGFERFLYVVLALVVVGIGLAIAGAIAKPKVARRCRNINRYLLLTGIAIIILFPLYMTIVNSLLRPDQIVERPPHLFPTNPVWSGYSEAWDEGDVSQYLLNSAIVTTLIVAGQLVTSICAAYAFAFLEFPLKKLIFVLFLATMMVPFEVVFITNLQTVNSLGNLDAIGGVIDRNTYGALAIPFLATGFGAFLIRQAFLSLPGDLKDAAALDGYGHMRFMTRVAVPLARPAIASLALFSFFAAWNQYLWPLVAADEDHWTVQVGLRQLKGAALDQYNQTFAGAVIAALPLFVLLLVFQKQLVRGLTAGAVKG
jgi:sn-glycerol 3-phosphate transport system permease protein